MIIEEFRDYVDFLRSQDEISYDVYSGLIDGIDTLEQEPCEDAISRQAVLDALEKVANFFPYKTIGKRETYDKYNEAWNDAIGRAEMEIERLPSVKPQYTDDEIQKIQDLEQAEIQKAYELGKKKTGHWIKYDKEYFTIERLSPVTHSIRECSECHTKIADFCGEMRFCLNCGARMVEPQESEG